MIELLQFLQRRKNYLTDLENYMELLLIFSTFTFATAGQSEGCFCLLGFAWQFGALAVFLAWIDLVLYLKKLPLTAIPINMLHSIVFTFLKLIYLPIILIIAFALPFYMLFSRVSNITIIMYVCMCFILLYSTIFKPFSQIMIILLIHQDFHC